MLWMLDWVPLISPVLEGSRVETLFRKTRILKKSLLERVEITFLAAVFTLPRLFSEATDPVIGIMSRMFLALETPEAYQGRIRGS